MEVTRMRLQKPISNNLMPIASPDMNVIMFDDYPTDWGQKFGKAWEEIISTGRIKEFMRCESSVAKKIFQRGFVLGTMLSRIQTW